MTPDQETKCATIRKAAEQSLEQVRVRHKKCVQVFNARSRGKEHTNAQHDIRALLTTIDTLLDVIDAYEAEHEAYKEARPTLSKPDGWCMRMSVDQAHKATNEAKATAIARMKDAIT